LTKLLTMRDDRGATSNQAKATINVGNTPPVPVIATPAAGRRFAVGEVIDLRRRTSPRRRTAFSRYS